jgi:hypothetical protein
MEWFQIPVHLIEALATRRHAEGTTGLNHGMPNANGAFPTLPGKDGCRVRCCTLGFLIAISGCFGQTSSTYPAAGVVKHADGKPLAGGRILFHPVNEPGHAARGIISHDGTFQLGTYSDGDGAVAGAYKVVITPAIPENALDNPAAIARYRSAVDLRYQNLNSTPLELNVKDDGSINHFDIVLVPPRAESR